MSRQVSQRDVVKAALRANRRSLELLDQRLAEVSKVVPAVTDDLSRARQSLAFSYLVDFTGAPAKNVAGTPVSGYVRMDSDSAFALSGIWVLPTVSSTAQFDTFGVEMTMTEENSGHQLTVIGRDTRPVSSTMPTPSGIALVALQTANQFDRGRFELPTECLFPRNALIRVDLFAALAINFTAANPLSRSFLVLHGAKLFGG